MKIIAEIGINHNGDLSIAKKLIDIAAAAGCDYVKFQKREPSLCVPEHMRNQKKSTPWGDMTYFEYKKRIEFDYADYVSIAHHCKQVGIEFFASVWDVESARFMREFSNIVKIPSACITNIALMELCREYFETVIISTGMSTEEEIFNANSIAEPDVIMHCHSTYPAPLNELELEYIKWLKKRYPDKQIGYSGHEINLIPSYIAAAFGAEWIERHITLDRNMWGSDQLCSIEPAGVFHLVQGLTDIQKSLGGNNPRKVHKSEKEKKDALRNFLTVSLK